MIGKIMKFNNKTKNVYIKGFDEITYFYKNIKNIELKENDIVEFECLLYNQNEMPTAINVTVREN